MNNEECDNEELIMHLVRGIDNSVYLENLLLFKYF